MNRVAAYYFSANVRAASQHTFERSNADIRKYVVSWLKHSRESSRSVPGPKPRSVFVTYLFLADAQQPFFGLLNVGLLAGDDDGVGVVVLVGQIDFRLCIVANLSGQKKIKGFNEEITRP